MASPGALMQVVDAVGEFKSQEVEQFVAEHRIAELRQNYQVVAIMGPQSSGKSTLLNHLFGTSFVMMDALAGRSQTTKGIWLSRSLKVPAPVTLVMDLEGSDGRERGEDDTNFERQSALFALAVADVLMVNIWCHDIGREHGSGKPLLKTIFQVNLKLFAPDPDRKRTVLLFVLRDKTKTPMPRLIETLDVDLAKMWDSIRKPPQYKDSKLTDFFEVQYAGLSHFEEKYEDFLADTVVLRRRFTPDGEDSLIRAADKLPGDALALSMRSIWEVVRSQKDLNLPAHKVMVANIRCAEIKDDQLGHLLSDQAWQTLSEQAGAGAVVPGFGSTALGLVDSCIKGYEAEAQYFDPKVRDDKLQELQAKLQALLQPLVASQTAALGDAKMRDLQQDLKLGLLEGGEGFAALSARVRSEALETFAHDFQQHVRVEGMPWDGQFELASFTSRVDAHLSTVRSESISSSVAKVERQLANLVSGPVIALLDAAPQGLWTRLHAVCNDAAASTEKTLFQSLGGFDLSAEERQTLSGQIAAAAWLRMEGHVREAALTRMSRMKDKFTEVFTLDKNKSPRHWSPREDVPALAQAARLAAANVLAQLAVIRMPTVAGAAGTSTSTSSSSSRSGMTVEPSVYTAVEEAVMRLARSDVQQDQQGAGEATSSSGAEQGDDLHAVDALTATSWPCVAEEQVLLQPHEVRTSWREFMSTSNVLVQQALSTQQANKLAGARAPPLWAILAILVLGWNEFMSVLFNPLYLLLGLLLFLFGRTLYYELDVDAEMQKGSLPAAISLSHKIVPATKAVVRKTVDAVKEFATHLPEHASRAQQYLAPKEEGATHSVHSSTVRNDDVQMAQLPSRHAAGNPSSAAGSVAGAAGTTLKQRRQQQAGVDGVQQEGSADS